MPQCSFSTHAKGHLVEATANVDTSPQPYRRLADGEVETGQAFMTQPKFIPKPVSGVGLDAYWLPDKMQLKSTDGLRLVTVSVKWPSAGQNRELALAVTLARSYLRTGQNPASPRLFKGTPAPP